MRNDAALYALARDITERARNAKRRKGGYKEHLSRHTLAAAHYSYAGQGLKICPRCGRKI